MNNSLISKILVILGSIVLVAGAFIFIVNANEETKIKTDNNHSEYKDNKNDYNVDIYSLRREKNNSEIYGVLRVDSVELYSILTKSSDNKYYLNHNLKGNKEKSGNPFIDYRNNSIDDKEIVIYGKTNNKEFNKLSKLFNRDTFNKDITIDLYLEDEKASYELKLIKMSENVITEEELITDEESVITTYNDTTDKIEEVEIEAEDEEDTVESENIFESLYKDSKYCKDECAIDNSENVIVIELVNEEPVTSNIIIVGIKNSK